MTALLIVGCSSTEDSEPSEPWIEAASYTYSVNSACGERVFLGTFDITVKDHVVVDAVAVDSNAQVVLSLSGMGEIPTLDDLVAEYREAVAADADTATIESAPGDGHPTRLNIDYDTDAVDDEACYTITAYAVSP